jgi:uncharacterized protein
MEKIKIDKSIIITLIIVLGVIFIAILSYMAFSSLIPNTNTIQAEGQSTIAAVPDIASIYFNVQTSGKTSGEATSENAKIVQDLKISLMNKEIDKEEIQTLNFNVYPEYDWINGKRTEKGYQATHQIRVELSIEEFDKIGEVIDAGINVGVGISYINFELSQELQKEYNVKAIKQASEDARIKAEAMASGLNQKLGKIVSVSSNSFDYYPWRMYSGSGMVKDSEIAKEEVTEIQPGEQEISARILVVFKIK